MPIIIAAIIVIFVVLGAFFGGWGDALVGWDAATRRGDTT